ncbi:MAG: hypothetical protein IPK28_22900 [Devosia sp.]|nr:hypothetical protein [Devosia sp.]
MIADIYLVPHSHTDIGYTHPQPIVLELHRRFLDQAMDLADATAHHSDGSAFRWMVEVSGTAEDWWRHASSTQRDRFVAAAQAGRIEVAGMRWNQTQLSDHHMLIEAMGAIKELRAAGVPIRSAMNSDVNGVNWGVIDVMLDHGIENFSMAINEHFGHAIRPRPQAFNWVSPTGRRLLVHNGLMYGSTVSGWLGVPGDLEKTRRAVPQLANLLEQRGYPHSVLIMQATNIYYHDNATPNAALPGHVRAFNAEGGPIRLRISTLSEAFDRLRRDDLSGIPEMRGDWPDWWSFGAGGTTRETGILLAGQRALRDAQQLASWSSQRLPRSAVQEKTAGDALALFVEHTFTADRGARRPDSSDADTQIHWKKARAYEGYSLARMLRRDGMAALASHHAGDEVGALVYNPLPVPVTRPLRIPKVGLTKNLLDPSSHVVQRQDSEFSDYPDDDMMMVEVDLPPLGYVVSPYEDLRPATGVVQASDTVLDNGIVRLRLDPRAGGLASLERDGVERIDADWAFGFGVPVLESPIPALRSALFTPPVFVDMDTAFDLHAQWHPDWVAQREAGRLTATKVRRGTGYADVVQTFAFSTGEMVTVAYRLAAGDEALAIEVVVDKKRIAMPHAYYFPMPMAHDGRWSTHYETAGAMVELDREILAGGNRHFLTTQRLVRLQGQSRGATVASPDLPLFQVGGFTFGRHDRGEVAREAPVLLAWLNNNYWDVNFEVTQAGPLRTRFHLLTHAAETVGRSLRRALPYVAEPQLHMLRSAGRARVSMFDIEADDLLITGFERDGDAVRLYLLNPDPVAHTLQLSSAALQVISATMINLDGSLCGPCSVSEGTLSLTIPARAWSGLQVQTA